MEIVKQMTSRALLAAVAAIAVAVAIITVLPAAPAGAQSDDEASGRIIARLLDDGRVEFGWQPSGGARVLPRQRHFPTTSPVGHWMRSSPVEVGGVAIGRINARLLSDGRIEFAFRPTHGQRIAPTQRYFPTSARVGRWLRSTEITIPASDGERATSSDGAFAAVSAGGDHTCALRESGAIECWGGSDQGQSDALTGKFTTVSAGTVHTCGLRENGAIECWGADGNWKSDAPEGSFTAVSVGLYYRCGLRESGAITCWGRSYAPEGSFTAVSAGQSHACGLRESGAIECWGDNGYNDEGQSDAPSGAFTAVSAGYYHTCAIRESGAIECWGLNDDGQLAAPAGSFTAVSVGGWHTCGLLASGAIECWGNNRYGQSDDPEGSYSAVSAGGDHTCALRESGAIECWGYNNAGQSAAPRAPGQLPTIRVFAGDDGVTEAQLSEIRQQMAAIVRWFAARWGPVATPPGRVLVYTSRTLGRWDRCALASGPTILYSLTCLPSGRHLAHEYAHVAQNQLIPLTNDAPEWMVEGMASWVETIWATQSVGSTSAYQSAQSGYWRAARGARNHYALDDPGVSPGPPHFAAYSMGFVAAERLAQLAGEQAILDFWPTASSVMRDRYWQNPTGYNKTNAEAIAEAFEATFGITLAEFYATFDDYLNGDPPSIQIAPNN